jgi:hypothetical protein
VCVARLILVGGANVRPSAARNPNTSKYDAETRSDSAYTGFGTPATERTASPSHGGHPLEHGVLVRRVEIIRPGDRTPGACDRIRTIDAADIRPVRIRRVDETDVEFDARLATSIASLRSGGSPQIPLPVSRIVPGRGDESEACW